MKELSVFYQTFWNFEISRFLLGIAREIPNDNKFSKNNVEQSLHV